jgi:hypothetical protein
MNRQRPRLKNGVDLQLQSAFHDGNWPVVIRLAEKRAKISNDQYYEVSFVTHRFNFQRWSFQRDDVDRVLLCHSFSKFVPKASLMTPTLNLRRLLLSGSMSRTAAPSRMWRQLS